MRRSNRRFHRSWSLVLVLASVLAIPGEAIAATAEVEVDDFFFAPRGVVVRIGDGVQWTNVGNFVHSSTSDGSFSGEVVGWNLDPISPGGGQVGRFFNWAATFPYHCRYHDEMRGRVESRMTSRPRRGTAGTEFLIRWAVTPPEGFVFDVQIREPGDDGFGPFRTGVTSQKARVVLNDVGLYRFRTRIRDPGSGGTTPFSPILRLEVT